VKTRATIYATLWALRRRLSLRARLRRARALPIDALAHTPLGTITGVRTGEPVAALTFDDGPHPLYTPRLLETLERHGARGTFFMVGAAARRHPEIVRRAAEAGHAIGNHTDSHVAISLIGSRERRAELQGCEAALAPYGTKLFYQSIASRIDTLRLGYDAVAWSLSAYDWLDREGAWMAEFIGERLRPGQIILLHDRLHTADEARFADRAAMIAAVELLLARTKGHYRFVTVPELLRLGPPVRRSWFRQADVGWLNTLTSADSEVRRYAI
jgi:peptidoglycan-N-acetylglucosamine deacetylase